jgi:hypothetical protein
MNGPPIGHNSSKKVLPSFLHAAMWAASKPNGTLLVNRSDSSPGFAVDCPVAPFRSGSPRAPRNAGGQP